MYDMTLEYLKTKNDTEIHIKFEIVFTYVNN